MGDKRKRAEVAVDENDEAVVDIMKSKKIKSGDKEKVKKEKKEKKDKKDKKDKKEKKEKKSKSKEGEVKDEEVKSDEEVESPVEMVNANGVNGTANEDKMDVDEQQSGDEKAEKSKKKDKKGKKEKKEKKEKSKDEEATSKKEKKEKKEKKQKKKTAEQDEKNEVNGTEEVAESTTASQAEADTPAENGTEETTEGAVGDAELEAAQKSQRFIVFISNLPYSATQESVTKHFEKLQPTSVRVPLERCGKKGRGFAFVEFSAFDRMKTCLKQYHGTMFEDGKKPARKIKVELTAGGGGSKSEARKMKILEKNQKLNEERARDAQDAKRTKAAPATNGASAADDQSYIHPSRRARVPV